MSRPLDWLEQSQQVPLNASDPITSDIQRYVRSCIVHAQSRIDSQNSPWFDSLVIPAYCAVLSGVLFISPAVVNALRKRNVEDSMPKSAAQAHAQPCSFRRCVNSVGSVKIFVFRFLQFLSIIALLALSVFTPLHDTNSHARIVGPFTVVDVVQVVLYVRGSTLNAIFISDGSCTGLSLDTELSSFARWRWARRLGPDACGRT